MTLCSLGTALVVFFVGPTTRHCDLEEAVELALRCEIEDTQCESDECLCRFRFFPEGEESNKTNSFCLSAGEERTTLAEAVILAACVMTLVFFLISFASCCCWACSSCRGDKAKSDSMSDR